MAAKWAFFTSDRPGGTTRLAVVVSGTLPTGTTDARLDADGNEIRALRLGRGAVSGSLLMAVSVLRGRFGLTADIGHTVTAGDGGYQVGQKTIYDFAFSLRFPDRIGTIRTRTVQLYMEWNGMFSARSGAPGGVIGDSGGHVAFLSPGVQVVLLPQFLVEASVQIPVVQNFNGQQPRFGTRVATGARLLFF